MLVCACIHIYVSMYNIGQFALNDISSEIAWPRALIFGM